MNIILVSNEGDEFMVSAKAIKMSITLGNMIECTSDLSDAVPLPVVDTPTLKSVILYMNHYENDIDRLECNHVTLNAFDKSLIGVDGKSIINLTNAANYLDIRSLLLCCFASLSNIIADMTPEEIRELLKPCDMEQDEIDQELEELKLRYKWLVEP